MRETLRALKSRNFRLFFIGQAISLIGSWMDGTAMSWLVYIKTGSATYLGFVAFCSLVPGFLMGPFAGVMVDRFDKRKLLIFTQGAQMVQAGLISVLAFTGVLEAWMIAALAVVAGIIGAIDMPGRQAYMIHLVEDREDLSNAIALNSSQFNLARLIGPAVAGIVFEAVGASWCFLINALSFLAVIFALLAITARDTANKESRGNILESITQGASYVKNFVPVRALIILMAVVSFLSGAQSVMMPVMAAKAFHGNASTLGFMNSAIGAGALASALLLASRKSVLGLGKWIAGSVALFGVALFTVSLLRSLSLALLVLPLAGAGVMTHMAATNTLLQTVIDDKMRGRVMSFYMMSFTGTMPFGSLIGGAVAGMISSHHRLGAAYVLAGVGTCVVLAALVFLRALPKLKAAIRPVYLEKGILTA